MATPASPLTRPCVPAGLLNCVFLGLTDLLDESAEGLGYRLIAVEGGVLLDQNGADAGVVIVLAGIATSRSHES
jgi:hypothetical protein